MDPIRALVADDDPTIVDMLCQTLAGRGIQTQSLSDGLTVVDHLRQDPPDVVLLDVEMPGYDGIELVSVIANDPELNHLPLLVISGSGRRQQALDAGAAAYFDKPADMDAVVTTLTACVEKSRQSRQDLEDRHVVLLGHGPVTDKMTQVLTASGHGVTSFTRAEDALAAMFRQKPGLLMVDLESAGEQAPSLVEQTRNLWRLRAIPAVALAGKAAMNLRLAVLKAGADALVAMPYFPNEIVLLSETLRRRSLEQTRANPLTGLPGARSLEQEVSQRLSRGEPFGLVYFDMDQFKAYNDVYGYAKADGMIRTLAGLLEEHASQARTPLFLCHIGGDDFLAVLNHDEAESFARSVTARFTHRTALYYGPEDRQRGGITATDRFGVTRFFPMVSLSAGVLLTAPGDTRSPAALSEAAAALKKQAKQHPDHVVTGG